MKKSTSAPNLLQCHVTSPVPPRAPINMTAVTSPPIQERVTSLVGGIGLAASASVASASMLLSPMYCATGALINSPVHTASQCLIENPDAYKQLAHAAYMDQLADTGDVRTFLTCLMTPSESVDDPEESIHERLTREWRIDGPRIAARRRSHRPGDHFK